MLDAISLTFPEAAALALICFAAGVVRGFSGFALSAIVMATAVLFLPPVELIPMLWWLEMTASLMMVRGGWREADRGVVIGLVVGSAVGTPIGLSLTVSLPVETSKLIVLLLILVLAATQLAKIRMAFLATRPGLYLSGLTAGIVIGLSNLGGMVVALYVLSQDAPARKMRAALVLYLFLSAAVSMVMLLAFGIMDMTAIWRALTFAPAIVVGVLAGQLLFNPKWEPYYKPFCLGLLIALAALGLARTAL